MSKKKDSSKGTSLINSKFWFGIIADDFTGATDVAGYLVREGTSSVQYFGVPTTTEVPREIECVVIALKTRSMAPQEAVDQSRAALHWLQTQGAEHIYFKYCSTFDSTPKGNIGPVADALMEELGESRVIICPSAPENGRTVYQGKIFVWDKALDESSMKDHPLNPMHDSDLRRLLSPQSSYDVGLITHQVVRQGPSAFRNALLAQNAMGMKHVVVDAIDNLDLDVIAAVARERKLSTGSAGLAAGIARARKPRQAKAAYIPLPEGRSIVISGSLSSATTEQVKRFRKIQPSFEIDPLRVHDGVDVVSDALDFIHSTSPSEVPLIYSTFDREKQLLVQELIGPLAAGSLIENTLAQIASEAVKLGFKRLIIAGGETSGAVVSALGITGILIGHEVAVGVPWTISLNNDPIALLLKSGNFGGPNFFSDATGNLNSDISKSTGE